MANKSNLPIKKVMFSFGPKHPLHNKVVDAYIETEHGGYDGRRVYAHTVEPIYFPEDPEGILVFDKDWNHIGYKTRAAYSQVVEGYVKLIG